MWEIIACFLKPQLKQQQKQKQQISSLCLTSHFTNVVIFRDPEEDCLPICHLKNKKAPLEEVSPGHPNPAHNTLQSRCCQGMRYATALKEELSPNGAVPDSEDSDSQPPRLQPRTCGLTWAM